MTHTVTLELARFELHSQRWDFPALARQLSPEGHKFGVFSEFLFVVSN